MLRKIMYPSVGWIILHVVSVALVFLLGYSIRFS